MNGRKSKRLFFILETLRRREKYQKKLWRRRCVRRVIFRNVEVHLLPLQHSHWITMRPVRSHLTPKMKLTFFIRNQMLNIILFNNLFEKKSSIFRENSEKRFGDTFEHFLGKGGVLPHEINITSFTRNQVLNILLFSSFFFFKKLYFLRKRQKPFLVSKSLLKRRGRLATKMNITFLTGMEVLNIF